MTTIKIEHGGTSQSVQLPDGFQFDVDEVARSCAAVTKWSCARNGRTYVKHSICWHPCPKVSSQRDGKTHFPRSERPS